MWNGAWNQKFAHESSCVRVCVSETESERERDRERERDLMCETCLEIALFSPLLLKSSYSWLQFWIFQREYCSFFSFFSSMANMQQLWLMLRVSWLIFLPNSKEMSANFFSMCSWHRGHLGITFFPYYILVWVHFQRLLSDPFLLIHYFL